MSGPLDAVRARIDAVDRELLRLLGERAGLAREVVAAKRAEAGSGKASPAPAFGLRPAREAQVLRRLLQTSNPSAASPALITRVWRELMGESLALQGPFHLTVFGGVDPARMAELARLRFGAAPRLSMTDKAETALAAARTLGGVAVLPLQATSPWWGRLLAEPALQVFAVLPCLLAWGAPAALAVAAVEVEPSGGDQTLWVTDAPGPAARIEAALGALGLPGDLVAEAGGLRLFALAGFVQAQDPRLDGAPGRLNGVIGSAPSPFDL